MCSCVGCFHCANMCPQTFYMVSFSYLNLPPCCFATCAVMCQTPGSLVTPEQPSILFEGHAAEQNILLHYLAPCPAMVQDTLEPSKIAVASS